MRDEVASLAGPALEVTFTSKGTASPLDIDDLCIDILFLASENMEILRPVTLLIETDALAPEASEDATVAELLMAPLDTDV